MAQSFTHYLYVLIGFKKERCAGVAKIIRPHVSQSCFGEYRFEVPALKIS